MQHPPSMKTSARNWLGANPTMARFLLCLLFLMASLVAAEAQSRPSAPRAQPGNAYEAVVEVPGLPRVLLIGDSISEGYTLPVRKLLQGRANVLRIPENGGPTKAGLAKLDQWLGTGKWDVIHFNWGLHDLMTFPDPKAEPEQPEKDQLARYEANLRVLVTRLKQTGARLIWASSTPVPDEMSSPRSPPNRSRLVKLYNDAAAKIMKEHHIPINDLNTYVTPVVARLQRAKDVHFGVEGSEFLGKQVAEEIAAALPKQ